MNEKTPMVESERWPKSSRMLHWGSALVIVALIALGFIMTGVEADSSSRLLMSRLHTALGLILMVGTIVRLIVRWRGRKPAPLPLPLLHRRGIAVVHTLLYATLFGLGASGAATGALSTWPAYLQGELSLAPELEVLASRQAHEALALGLVVLVVLHVGGVMVQELRGGGALRRMK